MRLDQIGAARSGVGALGCVGGTGVQSFVRGRVVAEAVAQFAEQAAPAARPGRRDDFVLDRIAFHAVKGGRFMNLVEDADRHQDLADTSTMAIVRVELHVGLLQLDDTIGRHVRVFVLDLGEKSGCRH